MQNTFQSTYRRNIFTDRRDPLVDRDRLDKLVFKVVLVCGLIGLVLPWGGV